MSGSVVTAKLELERPLDRKTDGTGPRSEAARTAQGRSPCPHAGRRRVPYGAVLSHRPEISLGGAGREPTRRTRGLCAPRDGGSGRTPSPCGPARSRGRSPGLSARRAVGPQRDPRENPQRTLTPRPQARAPRHTLLRRPAERARLGATDAGLPLPRSGRAFLRRVKGRPETPHAKLPEAGLTGGRETRHSGYSGRGTWRTRDLVAIPSRRPTPRLATPRAAPPERAEANAAPPPHPAPPSLGDRRTARQRSVLCVVPRRQQAGPGCGGRTALPRGAERVNGTRKVAGVCPVGSPSPIRLAEGGRFDATKTSLT